MRLLLLQREDEITCHMHDHDEPIADLELRGAAFELATLRIRVKPVVGR